MHSGPASPNGEAEWQDTIGVVAMHFLIGFLVLCFIVAVPELRAAGLVIVGVAIVGGLVIFGLLAANKPSAAPMPTAPTPSFEDSQAAQTAAVAFDAREKTLIRTGQIEVRNLWITSYDQPVTNPGNSIYSVGIRAVVRNNSYVATLTKIGVTVDLFDCPSYAPCDQIGSIKAVVSADIPPGQLREMHSADWSLPAIGNLPPLRGSFRLRYLVDYICASDNAPRTWNANWANTSGLVCEGG